MGTRTRMSWVWPVGIAIVLPIATLIRFILYRMFSDQIQTGWLARAFVVFVSAALAAMIAIPVLYGLVTLFSRAHRDAKSSDRCDVEYNISYAPLNVSSHGNILSSGQLPPEPGVKKSSMTASSIRAIRA